MAEPRPTTQYQYDDLGRLTNSVDYEFGWLYLNLNVGVDAPT